MFKRKGKQPRTVIKKQQMIKVLKKTLGVLGPACDTVDITRQTHWRWMNEDESYRKKVEELEDVRLDFAESALFKNMKDGKEKSILYYLDTKGKSRGYVHGPQVHAHINGLEAMDDDEIKQQIKRAGYVEQPSQLDALECTEDSEDDNADDS